MKRTVALRIVLLFLTLYVFLVSIKLMGISVKLFGKEFAELLISLTANGVVGLFIGILATSLIQSSSVTTSLVVGLTATGVLSIGSAIPIIMGANIGTSVTAALVSLAHIPKRGEFGKAFEVATVHDIFNILAVIILLPIELTFHIIEKSATWLAQLFLGVNMGAEFNSPLSMIVSPVAKEIALLLNNNPWITLILSAILIYFSLHFFVKLVKPYANSNFKEQLHHHIFDSPLRTFSFGLLFTAFVQSSSVTTSLAVPLVAIGLLSLEKVFPYIVGANIGTTFTSVLAALATGSSASLIVAFSHLLFNMLGCSIFYPLRRIPIGLSKILGKLAYKHRVGAISYVVSVFFAIPFIVIYLFH